MLVNIKNPLLDKKMFRVNNWIKGQPYGIWFIFSNTDISQHSNLSSLVENEVIHCFRDKYIKKTSKFIHEHNLSDFSDLESRIIKLIGKINKPLAAIFSLQEEYADTVNQLLNSFLNKKNHGIWSLLDKTILYQKLEQTGWQFKYSIFTDKADLLKKIQYHRFCQGDYVLKPAIGQDSIGVYKSKQDETIEQTFYSFIEELNKKKDSYFYSDTNRYIAMEYFGDQKKPLEISVEGLVVNGELKAHLIHKKINTQAKEPFYDQLLVSMTAEDDLGVKYKELAQICQNIIDNFNIKDCVFHLEFRYHNERFIPFDFALRPGGGYISHAFYLHSGVDLRIAHLHAFNGNLASYVKDNLQPNQVSTAIGCIYSAEINNQELMNQRLAELKKDPKVFVTFNTEKIANTVSATSDAQVMLGVIGSNSTDALQRFDQYKLTLISNY